MQDRRIIAAGGASFVVGAIAFVLVFSYLAARFNYPEVLDGSADQVLPNLRAGGAEMRAVWAMYAFIPLLLVPGAVGAFYACPSSRPRMMIAVLAAFLGTLAMCLGLMRWPSIHWTLADAYARAGSEGKISIDAVFAGLNLYLGNYIGEFLGESMLSLFFLLSGQSMLDEARFPRWVGWTGSAFALLFLIGALRNVTSSVQLVADINNTLLPLWMIILGSALIWASRRPVGLVGTIQSKPLINADVR